MLNGIVLNSKPDQEEEAKVHCPLSRLVKSKEELNSSETSCDKDERFRS
jgi:hypothetical protein